MGKTVIFNIETGITKSWKIEKIRIDMLKKVLKKIIKT